MKWLSILILPIFFAGCTNKLAEQDLTRYLEVNANVNKNIYAEEKLLMDTYATTNFDKQVLELKLELYKQQTNGTITLAQAEKAIDDLAVANRKSRLIQSNFRDKQIFLYEQGIRGYCYLLCTQMTYIQGKKSIFELILDDKDKNETSTTQPVIVPAD